MSKLLFHEGNRDGEVLGKVIDGLSDVLLIPAKSKFGMASFMQGYESGNRSVVAPKRLIAFRDRDFDFPVPKGEKLIIPLQSSQRIRVSYRSTIENYLISPEMLAVFNQDKELSISAIVDANQVKALLDEVARELTPYSAVRHALGATRQQVRLETTWTGGSGNLPHQFDLKYCQMQASQLIEAFEQAVAPITMTTFDTHLNDFIQQFEAADFISKGDYLVYYHGRDLMKRLSQRLGSGFSVERYYRFTLDKFDYTQFPDLMELRNWIEQ